MIKELKYLIYILIIFFFIFFTVRFYFSNENYKNSYRSISFIDDNIIDFKKDLILLKSNTDNYIEFVEYKNNKKMKKYSVLNLLYNNE